ncbi:MAG: hypothetical protein HY246_20645 [Proteobacteria bacterium]|nr:hypothetical protein [Pseudomonadota bacterium]
MLLPDRSRRGQPQRWPAGVAVTSWFGLSLALWLVVIGGIVLIGGEALFSRADGRRTAGAPSDTGPSRIRSPPAGEHATLALRPGQPVLFDFDLMIASGLGARADGSLFIQFPNGAEIVITGAAALRDSQVPLTFADGQTLSIAELWNALNVAQTAPAAGGATTVASPQR